MSNIRTVKPESGNKYFNRKASCLLTISDNIINKKAITAEERSKALTDMITLALEVVK